MCRRARHLGPLAVHGEQREKRCPDADAQRDEAPTATVTGQAT
jgi:hypothetical protein